MDQKYLADLAGRLADARCWHTGGSMFGWRFPPSRWFNLSPMDVSEAAMVLRKLSEAQGELGDYGEGGAR